MDLNIHKATIDDARAISSIWKVICAEKIYTAVNIPFTSEQERTYIAQLSDREGIFLAEIKKQIVGFQSLDLWAKYTNSFDHVGVIGTFILPNWRRNGIGEQLARFTINFAKLNHYEKIIIYVRGSNTIAQNFYKKLGFIKKGVLAKQVKLNGNYDDEIFMELFL